MKSLIISFKEMGRNLLLDKINFLLAIVPILIGLALYYYFGYKVYQYGMGEGKIYIDRYIENNTANMFFSYSVQIILYVVLFFLINWTFVSIVSLISSPFNDILSSRIEKKINGKPLPTIGETFSNFLKYFLSTLFNEFKKMTVIILLTMLSLLLSLFPFFTPISLFLTILLIAIAYIDYSWSRHNLKFGACAKDVLANLLPYSLGGAFFLFLVSVPVLNLLVPSFATSFFTTMWVKNNAQ